MTRNCNIFSDQSNGNYDSGNEIFYNAEVLKHNICDYNDAYILVKGDITVAVGPATQVVFKNCAPFTNINGTTIDDADALDLVMSIYNLLEYSSNYSDTTGTLWFHSKDETTNFMIILIMLMNFNLSSIGLSYWKMRLLNTLQIKLVEFLKMKQLPCPKSIF